MRKLKKKAHEMTADEMMKAIFHPKVHKHFKGIVAELNKPKPKK
jgi:hypothetical protein